MNIPMIKHLIFILIVFTSANVSYSQWIDLNTSTTSNLESISAVNNNVCWAAGGTGVVIRTTNGGSNWSNTGSGPLTGTFLYNIFAIDGATALCTGTNSGTTFVYRTSNAGVNWNVVFSQVNGFIDALYITNNSNGFMVGDPVEGRWSLWKTSNGGINWDSSGIYLQQQGDEYTWNNNLAVSDNSIWFQTNGLKIYYSSNFGSTWSAQIGPNATSYGSIWFNSATYGISMGAGQIHSTTNGGMIWNTQQPIAGAGTVFLFGRVNTFFGATDEFSGKIYQTNNSGNSWQEVHALVDDQYKHATASRTGNSGWACTYGGKVTRNGNLLGIQKINNSIPEQFSLGQNYPNPFNPSTKIDFCIGVTGLVNITVYDLLGKEIKVLVNEELKPGNYFIDFNGTAQSSGIYYYTMSTSGFTDTKKMVLVK